MAKYKTAESLFKFLFFVGFLVSSIIVHARSANEQMIAEIMQAAEQRNALHPAIQSGLISNQITIQKEAILALGRIGNPQSIKPLSAFLYSPQPDVRALTAYALAISENSEAVPALINRLKSEKSVNVITEILPALGLLGPREDSTDIIAVILGYLDHTDSRVVSASCDALSYAWQIHRTSISVPNSTQVYKLLKLAAKDNEIANHCLYALTRIRTEKALFDDSERIQQTLQSLTTDYQHQLMTMTLGAQSRAEFVAYFLSHFKATSSADLLALSAQAIAGLPATKKVNQTIEMLIEAQADHLQHDYVRIGLLDGLGQLQPSDRKHKYLKLLAKDSSEWVRSRAIAMLYATNQTQYLKDMLNLLESKHVTTQSQTLLVANALAGEGLEALIKKAQQSNFPSIVTYANSLVDNSEASEETPNSESSSYAAIKPYINKRMMIKTTKGNIVIQLLPLAPFTAHNFYQLAEKDYYDGTEFHRVIPGFVVQGGDIKAASSDGPGYTIREELYPVSHLEGTLGMASSGKDTAGAGFYFNLKDNYHLDRRYTVFARVVSGMDAVKKLGVGDSILDVIEYRPTATK